ncbi:hypothetical protein [Streptomyces sp. Agncl-13]|uniref:hypothetical protein n=1 Tax=Streptomyces sp. Agncl-13 TaxID=3400628 RepID=UPI003A89BBF9
MSFRGGLVGAQDVDVRKAIEELGADGTHDATPATAGLGARLPSGKPPPSGSTATSSPATC